MGHRVGADMAGDNLGNKTCFHQFADADAGARCIIGDDGQIGLLLFDQFVDQAGRRSDTHKSADHEDCTIVNFGDSFLKVSYFRHIFT